MVMASGSLSHEDQAKMVRRFVKTAQQEDPNAALAGFAGLALIASPGGPLRGMVQPAALPGLSRAYRVLVQAGRMAADRSIEGLLGARRE